MSANAIRLVFVLVIALLMPFGAIWLLQGPTIDCESAKANEYKRYQLTRGLQTSAHYLNNVAMLDACLAPDDPRKQKIHHLIKDIEIKSSSYATLNKLFFILSLVFAVCIVAFPIIGSIVAADSVWAKIFSPTQLPAITLLAGLCFAFYGDYKGKQTSAENLIRYAYASSDDIEVISRTVREGLASIDQGHDFSALIKAESITPEPER